MDEYLGKGERGWGWGWGWGRLFGRLEIVLLTVSVGKLGVQSNINTFFFFISFFSHRNMMIWFVEEAECPDRHRRRDLPPCKELAI